MNILVPEINLNHDDISEKFEFQIYKILKIRSSLPVILVQLRHFHPTNRDELISKPYKRIFSARVLSDYFNTVQKENIAVIVIHDEDIKFNESTLNLIGGKIDDLQIECLDESHLVHNINPIVEDILNNHLKKAAPLTIKGGILSPGDDKK